MNVKQTAELAGIRVKAPMDWIAMRVDGYEEQLRDEGAMQVDSRGFGLAEVGPLVVMTAVEYPEDASFVSVRRAVERFLAATHERLGTEGELDVRSSCTDRACLYEMEFRRIDSFQHSRYISWRRDQHRQVRECSCMNAGCVQAECDLPDAPSDADDTDAPGPTTTDSVGGVAIDVGRSWVRHHELEEESSNGVGGAGISAESLIYGPEGGRPMVTATLYRFRPSALSIRRTVQTGADQVQQRLEREGWDVHVSVACRARYCEIDYRAVNGAERTRGRSRTWRTDEQRVEATCTGTADGFELLDGCVLPEPPEDALSVDSVPADADAD